MIGLTIAKLLKEDAALMVLVPADNVYPYVANEDTPLPLIIYGIESLVPTYSKDGWVNDEINFTVAAYSENYNNLQSIIKEVRTALEMMSDSGTNKIRVSGMKEGYSLTEQAFKTELTFRIFITSY